jgi:hypothetical protein
MLYAAYGSNLHPRRLERRTPSATLLGTAMIDGWSLHFDKRGQDGSGKCTIRRDGGSLYCAIYDICPSDKTRLDAIEGVGNGYVRSILPVPGYGLCATYVAETGYLDAALTPFCWYRDLVLVGAMAHGFDAAYLARIASVTTQTDPDPARHWHNRRLAAAIAETLSRQAPGETPGAIRHE